MQGKIKTIFYLLLATFSIQCKSEIILIAEKGQSAADFPAGFIYYRIESQNAAIGSSGHVAFSGTADVDLVSTANNTNAVWAGLPGQLKVIIKENESPVGFPSDIVFSGNAPTLGQSFKYPNIVVNSSGYVGFAAELKGTEKNLALLVHLNGTTKGIMRTGEPAPGFANGNLLSKNNLTFAFSDAGMAIIGMTSGATPNSSLMAVWFYDYNEVRLLPPPVDGCSLSSDSVISINDFGEIGLQAALSGNACEFEGHHGVFKWHDDQWQTLIMTSFTNGDPVPGMTGTEFIFPNFAGIPVQINDQGDFFIAATIKGDNSSSTAPKRGMWVLDDFSNPKLIVQDEEFLNDTPDETIFNNSFSIAAFTNNDFSVIPTLTQKNQAVILIGSPKNEQPYSNITETGPSQLTVIAQENQKPSGFDANWQYSDIFNPPFLNRSRQFLFTGDIHDKDTNNRLKAVWRSDDSSRPRLKLMQGMKVNINGEDRILNQIKEYDFPSTTTSGRASRFSDNGHFLFEGTFSGNADNTLLMLLDDSREQRIFELAELLLPKFFAPANVDDRLLEGFQYRHYPDTKTYIGIRNGDVFVLGAPFGTGAQRIGSIDETLQLLEKMTGS